MSSHSPAAWQRAREQALERSKGRCAWCFQTDGLVVHHVDGKGLDGARAFDQTNLLVLCKRHHTQAHGTQLSVARGDRQHWPPTPD